MGNSMRFLGTLCLNLWDCGGQDVFMEKISNIVKQFKLSCGKVRTKFASFHIKNSQFSATIEQFLQHSYIMVVVSDPEIHEAATALNICAARQRFSELSKSGLTFGSHL